MGELTVGTWIDAPPDLCFDTALDIAAHVESAAFSHERVVPPGRIEGRLEDGDLLCFEGRHFGLRQRFCTRITRVDRPHLFVDEMVSGIFASLRHDHSFESARGGTLMTDRLLWTPPLGPLGRLADALFLERHMRWFVTTKQGHLKAIAERSAPRPPYRGGSRGGD